ncbi:VOC family protein [Streptomyces fenghuangensis]|uniref:VOC family protein n=1 Tax=Streptomyces sp. ICN903 TaxID=2964654 RepID=UPI001ED9C87E|nr:VOC family protein [Streptomyces sp. ICN903]MCG3042486.1 VOC family protein [Streptomyces sp. ICN903]
MTEAVARHAPGTPSWLSLLAHDPAASREFYHELFGWEYRQGPGPGSADPHFRALLDGNEVACIGQMPRGRQCLPAWLPYLSADDADKAAELVRLCGGTVGVGPLDMEGTMRVAIAADPAGASFGIRQTDTRPGARMGGGPGTVVWNELITHRASAVEKFYQTVFGLEAEPAGGHPGAGGAGGADAEPERLTLTAHGRIVGGVHGVGDGLPHDRGSHWLMYVEVADTDAAARRVTELGGRVLLPPHDTPYGRTARVADREGAPFAVIHTGRRGS